jgi:hypothetical protein
MKLTFRITIAVVFALFVMFLPPSRGQSVAQQDAHRSRRFDPANPLADPSGFVYDSKVEPELQAQTQQADICVQDDDEKGRAFSFSLSNQTWTLYYDSKPIANGTGLISQVNYDIAIDAEFGTVNVVGVVQPIYNRANLVVWSGGSRYFEIVDSNLSNSSCAFAASPAPPPTPADKICLVETVEIQNHAQILFDTVKKTWRLTYDAPNGDEIAGTYEDGPGPDSFIPTTDSSGDHAIWYVHGTGTYERGRWAGNQAKLVHTFIFPGTASSSSIKRGGALVWTYVPNAFGNFVYRVESSVLDRKLEGGCR